MVVVGPVCDAVYLYAVCHCACGYIIHGLIDIANAKTHQGCHLVYNIIQ